MFVCETSCTFLYVFADGGKDISSPQESNFKSRMKGTFNMGRQEVMLKDINKKLQRMLEETLMKNIEMQKVLSIAKPFFI